MTVAVTSRSFSRHPVLREELQARHPDVRFNDAGVSLRGEALIEHLSGCEQAIIALEPIDAATLDRLPDLKRISKFGVGLDAIDQEALRARGVHLAWTPGSNRRSVSELVLALTLGLLRNLTAVNRELREGTWRQVKGGCLSGRTVGVLGCGHVGRDLIELLRPFGCAFLAHDAAPIDPAFCEAHAVTPVGLEELLRRADVVSIHLPLNDATRGLLSAERLALLRPTAILINTSRGGIVDEEALKTMLAEERLAGAGFDVFAAEPPTDRELLSHPRFLGTPHIGGSTEEAILAMGRAAIAGLDGAGA